VIINGWINVRIYIEEIIKNYYNKSFRSAIVLLYSLVYYDLFGKLKLLANDYNDQTAATIVKEVNESIDKDSNYSDIEKIKAI